MNQNYEMTLKSFVEGCALSSIFAISLPLNSVRHFRYIQVFVETTQRSSFSWSIFMWKNLSEIEKEIWAIPDSRFGYSNLSQEEWQDMQSLAEDRSIVIKKPDKVYSVVVWDRCNYVAEAEKEWMTTFIRMLNLPRRFYKTLRKPVTKCFEI